ncbi:MAG: hypothetical protein WBW62_02465 [Solirubrobacterales bacterium]
MSALAAKTSPEGEMSNRSLTFLANLDLLVLAIALPIFITAGFPMVGYLVAAVLWIASRLIHMTAERKAMENLMAGKRNSAMGTIAATSLGSAWLMAIGVLVAGVAISNEVGLSAAVLLVVLFTLNLATRGAVALAKSDRENQPS